MNILAIDTSTKIELITVSNINSHYTCAQEINESHSITIFNNIDNLINKSGLSINDINLIGVGIGPGSFTGIRIAVSTARMLAQILQVPIVGVKSHLIFAASIDAEIGDNILIAFDAKKGRVFGAAYRRTSKLSHPVEILPPGDYKIDLILSKIDAADRTISFGDGIQKYEDIISKKIKNHKLIKNFKLSGENTCRLLSKIYNESPNSYNDYNIVVPFYARKSDAEILKNKV